MGTAPLTSCTQNLPLLDAILRELDAALVVCDRQGCVVFFNPAARSLFRHHPGLAVGSSLYAVCQRAPIAHTLRILARRDQEPPEDGREERETSLVCATVDNQVLLHCRIRPLLLPGASEPLQLFTFADLTRQLTKDKSGGLLPDLIEEMRAPLSNLTVAATNLQDHPEMDTETRAAFTGIVSREGAVLIDRFKSLVWQSRAANRCPWPLSEVNSADLFADLLQRLSGAGAGLSMDGEPLWLQADSFSLLLTLEALVRFIRELKRPRELTFAALFADRRVYLDLIWPGETIPQAALNHLLQRPLPEGGNGVTIAEVLWRHDSDLWSQRHQRRGYALLRLPLPRSDRQWQRSTPPEGETADSGGVNCDA